MRGWFKNSESKNSKIRKLCVDFADLDIIGIAETHLVGKDELKIPGYIWFGQNRQALHRNAGIGSGGIGFN